MEDDNIDSALSKIKTFQDNGYSNCDSVIENNNNKESYNLELKLKELSKNKKVMQLFKQIMEKIAMKKKYKENSIYMMEEVKSNLQEILAKITIK